MGTDLREQLQAALSNAYALERELGRGGMSRVFVAEERSLGRRVAVKVLPPERSAGIDLERFEREVRLAASLSHPHIVPLPTPARPATSCTTRCPSSPGSRCGPATAGDTERGHAWPTDDVAREARRDPRLSLHLTESYAALGLADAAEVGAVPGVRRSMQHEIRGRRGSPLTGRRA